MSSSLDLSFNIHTQDFVLDAPRLTELQSFGPLLNAKDSFGWLHSNRGFIGWTYTINPKIWTFLVPSKLIVDRAKDLVDPKTGIIYNQGIRQASCCHIKCYIGKKEMLVGSFNLTAPTIEDLCVLIKDKTQVEHMRKIFNIHWKALARE